jgi:tetratricopeptide (TPR) repeat protein
VLFPVARGVCDDVPKPAEAIEKARALERRGLVAEAEEYLAELVAQNDGPLARDATVLLEAARLTTEPATSRAFAERAIERTHNDEVLEAAYELRGDSFFAEGRYLSASVEYERAMRHESGRGPGQVDLKRARSLLASGDAGEAVVAYREIADWGATPGEITPLAEVGLARSLFVLGRFPEAAEQFERTAGVYRDSEVRVRALAGAAEARESAGEFGRARASLELIVLDYPDSYEAVLAREKLRDLAPADTTAAAQSDSTSIEAPQDRSGE